MNKISFGFICFIFMCQIFSVSAAAAMPKDADDNLNKSEFRSAAFFPASERFRKIYGDVGVSLQVEQTRTWRNHRYLEIWGNTEWIFMDGKARRSCGSTDIDILNISFGLKTIGKVYRDSIYLYAGIGPDVGITFIENKLRCCKDCNTRTHKQHRCNVGIGGIAKTGAQFFFTPHFYLNLFADYLYLPVHFHRTTDVGGFKVGGGLGGRY